MINISKLRYRDTLYKFLSAWYSVVPCLIEIPRTLIKYFDSILKNQYVKISPTHIGHKYKTFENIRASNTKALQVYVVNNL